MYEMEIGTGEPFPLQEFAGEEKADEGGLVERRLCR
jgi:hypothetical protein